MSTAHYFAGTEPVATYWPMKNAEFAAKFPGAAAKRYDSFSRMVGRNAAGEIVPVTRVIFRKANPSNHKCDARCRHAKGNNCECSCGGKYHGAGN